MKESYTILFSFTKLALFINFEFENHSIDIQNFSGQEIFNLTVYVEGISNGSVHF